ncbi:MAG: hypothetical protein UHS49_02140 [Faecalimonas sp.]|nr:hypothetical protein [Faecalimonas sp.]
MRETNQQQRPYTEEELITEQITKDKQNYQHEDAALKYCMQSFAEVLLGFFQIAGDIKVVGPGPTELVDLNIVKRYEDFNLLMEDGSCKHFEFQSTEDGIEDLRRFRLYEALYCYQYKTPVTTYVLYSGSIRNPKTELTDGYNTYRVYPLVMGDIDVGGCIVGLYEKIQKGKKLTKEDIVPLALCPLMGGKLSQKERIQQAFALLREITEHPEETEMDTEEIGKVEAVIYTMAEKFLETVDLDEVMEGLSMTRIGRRLVESGRMEGRIEGVMSGQKMLLCILNAKGTPSEALRERIQKEANLEVLESWGALAVKTETLEQFEEMMETQMA